MAPQPARLCDDPVVKAALLLLVLVPCVARAQAAACDGGDAEGPIRCAAVRVAAVGRAIDPETVVGGLAAGGRVTLGFDTGLGAFSLGATFTGLVEQPPSLGSAVPVSLAPALWFALPGVAFDLGPVLTFAGRPTLSAMLRVSAGRVGVLRRWGVSLGDPLELTPLVVRGEFGEPRGPGLEVSLLLLGARVGVVWDVEALGMGLKLTVEASGLTRSWNGGAAAMAEWGAR